ncbi:hypothetical protein [Haloprofundus sp. MHR1]|uniref:hypothetical protein n=1 Tax=Haloprofundus sp. MHR1 TaxID=2572921 RepID=UPI0010BF0913|nr:hypothetical protein [Haloprofundus sp. MHR1]QCJ48080.1 hypothetical protein FCF25_13540 [Haloprofundus sp. MHR1]
MDSISYQHILYYSPSHIQQLFFDRIDDTSKVVREEEERSKLRAGLSAFLPGNVQGEKQTRESVMKTVNHSEDYIQTKRVVNDLLDDNTIPRIKELDIDNISTLYRFSCECQLLPADDSPEGANLVEVIGREGDFSFEGITSLDNWSSLSDTLFAIRNDIPYPLEGIIQLRDIENQIISDEIDYQVLEQADCKVNFIFICQSNREEFQKWLNRRTLMNEYYERGN